MDVSVVLPVLNESANLKLLLPRLRDLLHRLGLTYELLLIDGGSTDETVEVASQNGATVLTQQSPGYAAALKEGFAAAQGRYILTLDADMSHDPEYVAKMWRARKQADVVIASRYTRGGVIYTSRLRRILSRLLNAVLRRILAMPVRDLSSGFRLYRREVIEAIELESTNFEIQEEILVKAYCRGFSIIEVPFTYFPREGGRSHARLVRFGVDIARSAFKLWRLRNSIESADYDERAFYSWIPMQRAWQRRRHRVITAWARAQGRILDIGCGSSVIIQSLNNAVGLEIDSGKVRYLSRRAINMVQGSAFALPFKDESFDCVISSQVIEHIPYSQSLFTEMWRVLRPGGTLIIGTPDYATWTWRIVEPLYGMLIPGGYKDEHITHYTRESLSRILSQNRFTHEDTAYVFNGELIMRWRKPRLAEARIQLSSSQSHEKSALSPGT